jgi:hypothetical protein
LNQEDFDADGKGDVCEIITTTILPTTTTVPPTTTILETTSTTSTTTVEVFTGFFAPIENDVVNLAKAGQAIPVKWRLTDGSGMPISDPASFVGLYSYSVSCIDFLGDPIDEIEEYAAGASGLQYKGDGYWQFNWKTPKTYAGQCRKAYIKFTGGMTSPLAKFKFKE